MKKISLMFMLALILFVAVGCAAKSEIEKLAIVVAFGVDITADGKYMVSTQVLKTQKQPSGGGMGGMSGKQSADVMGLIATGDTLPDALEHLSTELGKKLELSHVKFVVIGEEVAKSGIGDLIDFLARDHALRSTIVILVTRGQASEIIKTATPEDTIPANAVEAVMNLQSAYGYVPVISSRDFAAALTSKTASPIAGVIEPHGDPQAGRVFKMTGTAIFKKDKLIGYMNEEETRGIQWIKGKVKTGIIVIPSPDKGKITLNITSAGSKITPVIKDNKPVIQIAIQEEGYIREMTGGLNPMEKPELLYELNELQNEAIKKEIGKALYAAQKKFKADIFDFGEVIHRDYPVEWKRAEENWSEIFPDLDVEIKVNSSIRRIGVISKPLY